MMSSEDSVDANFESGRCDFSIKSRTLHCKAAYYLLHSIIGCIFSFQNVFLVSIGLSASEAGFISGMCYVASSFAGPCWGSLADKTGYRKLIFLLLCFGIIFSFTPLPWVAREMKYASFDHNFSNNFSLIRYGGSNNRTDECSQKSLLLAKSQNSSTSEYGQLCDAALIRFSNPLFYSMLSLCLIGYTFLLSAQSFLDSIVMNVIQNTPTNQGYGHQRMFGGIGSGSTNLIAGFAADWFKHPTLSEYTPIFYFIPPFIILLISLFFVLFKHTSWKEKTSADCECNEEKENIELYAIDKIKRSRIRVLIDIFRHVDNIFIMTTTLVVGVLRSLTIGFLYLVIRDEMNGSRASMGLAMLMNSLSSTAMFFFTKKLIAMLGGPVVCVEIGVLAWLIRSLLISYIKNSWFIALPQLLQSFGFALFWSAMIQYVYDITPKEVYITMFTILTSLHYGVGGFLGNIIGGVVYNQYRGPTLYRGMAVVAGMWLVIILLYYHGSRLLNGRLGKRKSRERECTGDLDV